MLVIKAIEQNNKNVLYMEFKNNIGLIEVYLNGIERYISLVEQMLIENGAEDGLYEIKFEEHGHGVKTKVNYVSKKIGPI